MDEQLVSAIYGIALETGDWTPALDRLRVLVNAVETAFSVAGERLGAPVNLTTGRTLCAGARASYFREFARIDPKQDIFDRQAAGFLFNDARVFDDAFIARDPFYQEYSRPLGTRHTLDLLCEKEEGRQVFLAAMRSERQGPFDRAEEQRLRRASPHFTRAFRLGARLQRAQIAAGILDRLSFGVIVLDHLGNVALANAAACSVCERGQVLRFRGRKVEAGRALDVMRFERAVGGITGGRKAAAVLRAGDPAEAGEWGVWVAPLQSSSPLAFGAPAAAVVLVVGPDGGLTAQDLKAEYALTEAEADLALSLARGETLQTTAARRGVKSSTVRTQLLAVLGKMGLHRQADLVRRLASLGGTVLRADAAAPAVQNVSLNPPPTCA